MTRLILLALLFGIGCNSQETPGGTMGKDTVNADTNTISTQLPLAGCYSWAVKQDTATMKLDVSGSQVTGTLRYDWHEKDRNTGELKGVIKNDLIVADYIFRSEGMTSVRQVVFKMTEGGLVEGYGEYDDGTDTTRFKDIGQLRFQDDRVFTRVKCDLH